MSITTRVRPVHHSSVTGKNYVTLGKAIRAEAIYLLSKKYPYEAAEYDGEWNEQTWPASTWKDLPRSDVFLRRLMLKIANHYKETA